MSRSDKLIERFLSTPSDFTWDELTRLLRSLGYFEKDTGKTGGSRRKFVDSSNNVISLHKPHPGNIVKKYVMQDVKGHLIANGKIVRQ